MKKPVIRDYTGKTIYLGIDVHKKTYAITAKRESYANRSLLQANRPFLTNDVVLGFSCVSKKFPTSANPNLRLPPSCPYALSCPSCPS